MSYVSKFIDLVKEGMDKYGLLYPSSRISNTRLILFTEFEAALTQLIGMDETVSFSSGYLAGQSIIQIFNYKNCFIAPQTHPAILKQQISPTFQSRKDWEKEIIEFSVKHKSSEIFIVSDAVNVNEGLVYDFNFLKQVDTTVKIICLIDDSHGIGLLGSKGEGIISYLPKAENIEYILSYSLSKAFHLQGGAVSCSKEVANLLRMHPNYAGSTALSPALAYAFLHASELYAQQRKKLFTNIEILKHLTVSLPFIQHHQLPIFNCSINNVQTKAQKQQIILSSFSYPDPNGTLINRIVINALHTDEDLQKLTDFLITLL